MKCYVILKQQTNSLNVSAFMPKHKQGERQGWERGRQADRQTEQNRIRESERGEAWLMALVSDLFQRGSSIRRQERRLDDFFAPSFPFPDYERRHGTRSRVKPKGDSIV